MMSGIFWGTFLILLGMLILINVIFGIKLPFIRLLIGIILIYLGITFITGLTIKNIQKKNYATFMAKTLVNINDFNIQDQNKYEHTTIFGSSHLNLSDITPTEHPREITINVVCGESEIKINPQIPTHIIVNAAFAHVEFPDNTKISFGTYTHQTNKESKFTINIRVVFGKIKIIET